MKRIGKKAKIISAIVAIMFLIAMMITIIINQYVIKEKHDLEGLEKKITATYREYVPGEEIVEGTNDNVLFSAFFLRDLDGDGNAEKYYGSCSKVSQKDTLYLDLNVMAEGSFVNGKIEIYGNNFMFNGAFPADEVIKENYVSQDLQVIELNDITNGMQKLLFGKTQMRNPDNNINYYTDRYNRVIFSGTYIDEDGNETPVRKEIYLTKDYYGETETRFYSSNYTNTGLNSRISEGNNINLSFEVTTEETKNELLIKDNHLEMTIPQLNGFDPIAVSCTNGDVDYTYNATTRVLTIDRRSTVDDDGNITKNAYTSTVTHYPYNKLNNYSINLIYPYEAYERMSDAEKKEIKLKIPMSEYYDVYNNPDPEYQAISKSNVATTNYTLRFYQKDNPNIIYPQNISVSIGKYVSYPYYTNIISKRKALRLYNGSTLPANEDYYNVEWEYYSGTNGVEGKITLNENGREEEVKPDSFEKNDNSLEKMTNLYNIRSIFFVGSDKLEQDGVIRVYDADTGLLLLSVDNRTIENYTSKTPYVLSDVVKHIKVEIEGIKKNARITIGQTKELFNEDIYAKYSLEEFNNLKYIRTYLTGYLNDNKIGDRSSRALYPEQYSKATLELRYPTISTQYTLENQVFTINTQNEDDAYNRLGWHDGSFLIKMPEDIKDVKINNVTISNDNLYILSYEVLTYNNIKYIKVLVKNKTNEPQIYSIDVDADLTPDPTIASKTDKYILYSYNNEGTLYAPETADTYDINNNGRTDERINYHEKEMFLLSPNSLITNQKISNFDKYGTEVVTPQIADIRKTNIGLDNDNNTATIGIQIKNNFSMPCTDIVILGKLPFAGNTDVLKGTDLGSEFTAYINSEIIIPEKYRDVAQVYYSANENPTTDITDPDNGWMTYDQIENKETIKTFIVVLNNGVLEEGELGVFSYDVKLPHNVPTNALTYSQHAVYYSLVTENGKFRTQTEPNKMGIRACQKYDLLLTKYQKHQNKLLQGATYKIEPIDEFGNAGESLTSLSNSEGALVYRGLYAETTYRLTEIKAPNGYELNTDTVEFVAHLGEDGLLTIEYEGNVKREFVVSNALNEFDVYTVDAIIEDEVLGKIKLTKKELNQENLLKGARYRLTGKGYENGTYLTTNDSGTVELQGLTLGEEYTLEETKAPTGYYINEGTIKFTIENNMGIYSISNISGNYKDVQIEEEDLVPKISFTLEDEKIPQYNLSIIKKEKDSDTVIPGVRFALYYGDTLLNFYETDENGKIDISGLYQYVASKNVSQTYRLKEVYAPEGLSAIKDIVFHASYDGEKMVFELENDAQSIKEINGEEDKITLTIEDPPAFKLIKIDGDVPDGEPEVRLQGAKFAIYLIQNGQLDQPAKDVKGNILGTLTQVGSKEYYLVETNENGEITAALPEGFYKAVEIIPSDPKYDVSKPSDTTHYFGVGASSEPVNPGEYKWSSNSMGTPSFLIDDVQGYVIEGSSNGVRKYNKDGSVMWEKRLGGVGYILEDNDGAYLVAVGSTLYKLDKSGDEIWRQSSSTTIKAIYQDNDDNYYILNSSDLEKYTNNRELLWTYNVGISSLSNTIRKDYEDNIVVQISNTLIKLTPQGHLLWKKALPMYVIAERNGSSAMVLDEEGYLVGGQPSASNNNIVCYKYDYNGNEIFHKTIATGFSYTHYTTVNKDNEILFGFEYDRYGNDSWGIYTRPRIAIITSQGDIKNMFGIFANAEGTTGTSACIQCFGGGNYNYIAKLSGNFTNEHGQTISSNGIIVFGGGMTDVQEQSEITVENHIKHFKITTDIEEFNGIKGGTISGEDQSPYESVIYNGTSTKEIKIVPDQDYEIVNIKINNTPIDFTPESDDTYTLPAFENMLESKHIVVKFSKKDNKITINKIDEFTGNPVPGVGFDINQIEYREEPNAEEIVGTKDGTSILYEEINHSSIRNELLGELDNTGAYYKVPDRNSNYNSLLGELQGRSTSYVIPDLDDPQTIGIGELVNQGETGNYYIEDHSELIGPKIDKADYHFDTLDGSDVLIPTNGKTYRKEKGIGNDGVRNSQANSYFRIDLSEQTGNYKVVINARIESESYDHGYATILEAPQNGNVSYPSYGSAGGFMNIYGTTYKNENYISSVLQGGKIYNLFIGYYKDTSVDTGRDQLEIHSIKLLKETSHSLGFSQNGNEYTSNNATLNGTEAKAYIPIDLTGLSEDNKYTLRVKGNVFSDSSDYAYLTINESTDPASYNNDTDRFGFVSGKNGEDIEFFTPILRGGKQYYLHIGYRKDNSYSHVEDKFVINGIDVFGATERQFGFVPRDGKYVSTNAGYPESNSDSYIPIDLTGQEGKQFFIVANAEISSEANDKGFLTINQSTANPLYTESAGRFCYIDGASATNAKDYTSNILDGGNIYYLHLGYHKDEYVNGSNDEFIVNSINLCEAIDGKYGFERNDTGALVSNNQEKHNTNADTCMKIDLSGEPEGKKFKFEIDSTISSEQNKDYGYVYLNSQREDMTTGRIISKTGNGSMTTYTSNMLYGGNIYYLHFQYNKNASVNDYLDEFVINRVELFEVDDKYYSFNYNDDGELVSTNQGKDNTTAYCYIPIDLSGMRGLYKIKVTSDISCESGDRGYAAILEDNTTRVSYNDSTPKIINQINGTQTYIGQQTVKAGKIYYLHVGFFKNSSSAGGTDTFKIKNIELELDNSDFYNTSILTNGEGKGMEQIPFGRYRITETITPDNYFPLTQPIIIDFFEDTDHEITITNEKRAEVIVHHYLKDKNGNYTEQKLADDEIMQGKAGDSYATMPDFSIPGYDLEKINGNYVMPSNATGTYTNGTIEVIYYYEEKPCRVITHHYIENTSIKVPLLDGTEAEDVVTEADKGTPYVTTEKLPEELDSRYELVEIPLNATGVMDAEITEVTYYYKEIKRDLKINKYDLNGTTPLEGATFKIEEEDSSLKGELLKSGSIYSTTDLDTTYNERIGNLINTGPAYKEVDYDNYILDFDEAITNDGSPYYYPPENAIDLSSSIGSIVNNGKNYGEYELGEEINNCIGEKVDKQVYYFNQKTDTTTNEIYYESSNRSANTVGNSYIPINLEDENGYFIITVDASVSSEANCDIGFVSIREANDFKNHQFKTGQFVYISGTDNTAYNQYNSEVISGGKNYYLHLGYRKDGSVNRGSDSFKVKNIKVYRVEGDFSRYSFVNEEGKIKSNNNGVNNSIANAYIPIDLTDYSGKVRIKINAENSAQSGDIGYAVLTNSTDRIEPNDYSINYLINLNGTYSANNYYTNIIEGGNIYYLQLGYYKNGSGESEQDKFIINSIEIEQLEERRFTFEKQGNQIVSNNQGKSSTLATGYMPIDLRNIPSTEKYRLVVNAEISSEETNDYGFLNINTSNAHYTTSTDGRFCQISGEVAAKNYESITLLQGGTLYYLHMGYNKNDSIDSGEDTFKINSIKLYGVKDTSYGFEETIEGKYVSTIQGLHGRTSESTIPIDLSGLRGKYKVVINATKSSASGDNAYIGINKNRGTFGSSTSTGRFAYITSNVTNVDYPSEELEGGDLYYLHFGYFKNQWDSSGTDSFTINSINIYESKQDTYYFEENNGTYTSNNQGKHNTTAKSTIPIDLTNLTNGESVEITVNAEIDSHTYDYGYVIITNSPSAPNYDASGRMFRISNTSVAKDYKQILTGGNMYYLHMGYRKDGSVNSGTDTFKINYIKQALLVTTDDEGKINTHLGAGNYTLKEIQAPDGYQLVDNEQAITVDRNTNEVNLTLTNELKKGTIIVHHYEEGTSNKIVLTDGTIVEDEQRSDYVGEIYATQLKEEALVNYNFVRTVGPTSGLYEDGTIEITYYYSKKPFNYTVEYYYQNIKDDSKTDIISSIYGTVIDTYTDKVIDGYEFDKVETIPLTVTHEEDKNIIRVYYVKRTDLPYTVKYLEQGTGRVLHDQKDVANRTFEEVITERYEPVDGFNLVSPEEQTITISTGTNEIIFYYTKRTDLEYRVNYLEVGTDRVLHEQKVAGNQTFETVINAVDEEIPIDGFYHDHNDPESIQIRTDASQNVINIYYTKRADLKYTVNYLEVGTNRVLHDPKVAENQTFETVINAANEEIEIDGFYHDHNDPESIQIRTDETQNVINIYYTKRADLKYTVNYLEVGTNRVLHDPKVAENQTFETVINAANEEIEIDGFYHDHNDPESIQIVTDETQNVINIYYVKRSDLHYTVNYLEDGTNRVLHDQKVQDKVTFEQVINAVDEEIDIDGFYHDHNDPESIQIVTDETQNVINIYYTKRSDLSYTVNYLEVGTERVLHDPKTADNVTFEQVINAVDEEIDIDGFYHDHNDPESIQIVTDETQNVINIYYVKRSDLHYTVNYLEDGTNRVLHDPKTAENVTFEQVINAVDEEIPIDGFYHDHNDPESIQIVTDETQNVINIYYVKRNDLHYTVNYLEDGTNRVLHDPKVQDKVTFEQVINAVDEEIDIDGFYHDHNDPESIQIVTDETQNVINIYYVKRSDLHYTVNYLEDGTNRVLHDPKTAENVTFEQVINAVDEEIDIDGFYHDHNDPESIQIVTDETQNVINIYYTKRSDLSYTVNYLEVGTERVLHDQKKQDNVTFEQVINAVDEEIDIDGFYHDHNDPESIQIVTDETQNVINIYYTKRNDLKYTVNYLEVGTERILHDPKVVENVTFEETYNAVDEEIEIDGFYHDHNSPDQIQIVTDEAQNVINIYYVKRNDLSYTVNYLEKGTGRVLHDQKKQDNVTFEQIINASDEEIDIDGFNHDSNDPEQIQIVTDVDKNVINIYYTKRDDLTYKIRYIDITTSQDITEPKIVENVIFETVVRAEDEIIDFYKYDFVEYDKESITVGTNADDNIINLFYIKKETSVLVHHYIYGTTDKVSEDVTIPGRVDDEYHTQVATDIPEYLELVEEPLNKDGNMTVDQIEVTYYYKLKGYGYRVNYLDVDTGEPIHDPKYMGDVTYGTTIQTADEIIEFEKYEYDSADKDELTIGTNEQENIINIYYKKKVSTVTVHHYIEGTTYRLAADEKIRDKVDTPYTTSPSPDVNEDYEVANDPENKSGVITLEPIEVIYYYKLKEAKVFVNYYDIITNEKIADEEVITKPVRSSYQAIQKEIENYTYVEDSGNTSGYMTLEPIYVNIYYKHNAEVIVNYIYRAEDGTEELLKTKTEPGLEGDVITVRPEDFDGYVLVERPENETVTMTVEPIVLNYYYVKVSQGVLERHIDEVTNEILYEELHKGKEGDPYDIPSKEFEGYDLVEDKLPDNSKGTMKNHLIEVDYYYIYKTKVTANYIDINHPDEPIADPEVYEGHETDPYETVQKNIEDYVFIEDTGNTEGEMTKEDIVVNYYYAHKSAGVDEKHIDDYTGEVLEEAHHSGNEGDPYDIPSKQIENYDLVMEKLPDNSKGKMTIEPIVVEYYYARKAQVVAEYVDYNTGEKLTEDVIEKGHYGDPYKTKEKFFEDYKIVLEEYPTNTEGEMNQDKIVVTYKYVHKAVVIEKHYDDLDGRVLYEEKHNGYVGDDYSVDSREFPTYELYEKKLPNNNKGTMTLEPIIVEYYYRQRASVIEKHIDEITQEILKYERHNGYVDDDYYIRGKAFNGYELIKEKYPTNYQGKMKAETEEVIFWYRKKAKVIAKYLDIDTGKEISVDVTKDGYLKDKYSTEEKTIYGYMLVLDQYPTNSKGYMDKDVTVVKYYYKNMKQETKKNNDVLITVIDNREKPTTIREEIIYKSNNEEIINYVPQEKTVIVKEEPIERVRNVPDTASNQNRIFYTISGFVTLAGIVLTKKSKKKK